MGVGALERENGDARNDGTVRGLCGGERVKVTSQAVAFRGVVLGSVA